MDEATILNMYSAIYPDTRTILRALFIFNLPFTAGKFIVDSIITFILYKRLSYFIKNGFRIRKRKRAADEADLGTADESTPIEDDGDSQSAAAPNVYVDPSEHDTPVVVYSEQPSVADDNKTKDKSE